MIKNGVLIYGDGRDMAKREKQKKDYIYVLEPIIYDDKMSAFNLRNEIDLFDTTLVLEDYDWMNYRLSSTLPTKAYGDIKIEFKYLGTTLSYMKVETDKKIYTYEFKSDLFKKHIIKFLQKHIQHWESNYAFSGIEEVVNFYNEVIMSSDTVEDPELIKLFHYDDKPQ